MRKLLQQALDALDSLEQNYGNLWQFSKTPEELDSLLNTIRAELEKPEQEPVGYQYQSRDGESWHEFLNKKHYEDTLAEGSWPVRAIYAAPTEPNCKFPTCHSQEYQNKLVQEILEPEPIGYANADELDNMLDDRNATISPTKTGWYATPVYLKGTTNV